MRCREDEVVDLDSANGGGYLCSEEEVGEKIHFENIIFLFNEFKINLKLYVHRSSEFYNIRFLINEFQIINLKPFLPSKSSPPSTT